MIGVVYVTLHVNIADICMYVTCNIEYNYGRVIMLIIFYQWLDTCILHLCFGKERP